MQDSLTFKTCMDIDDVCSLVRYNMEIIRSYLEYLQAMQIHDKTYKQTKFLSMVVNLEYSAC